VSTETTTTIITWFSRRQISEHRQAVEEKRVLFSNRTAVLLGDPCRLENQVMIVVVVSVGHRREVYD